MEEWCSVDNVNWPPNRTGILKADISSVSPSSERITRNVRFYNFCMAHGQFNGAKCNLGEVKVEPMLPAVFLVCASNQRGRHPWNLQGRVLSEHCRSSLANLC